MKYLGVFTALLFISVSTYSTALSPGDLYCEFGGPNPRYDMKVTSVENGDLYGQLDEIIFGITGATTHNLGNDPLEIRFRPSTCDVRIFSQNHPSHEFYMQLILKTKSYKQVGKVQGQMFGHSKLTCYSHSDFAAMVYRACGKYSHMKNVISFSSLKQLRSILQLRNGSVSDIEGVNIH